MEKIKFGVVGLGHRGREMAKLAALFEGVEFKAACDIIPTNWYETQWLSNAPFSEMFPKTEFYENYDINHIAHNKSKNIQMVLYQ